MIYPCFPSVLMTIFLVLTVGNTTAKCQTSPANLPNVVLINADDLGYGDLSVYGATRVQTPHIDQLAAEGIRLTDFHSVSAVCSPSRYALLTGQYPFRINLWDAIFLKASLKIDTNRVTIADLMKKAGYATAAFGKWHLGFGEISPVDWNKPLKPGPLEVGFDYYFGVPVLNSHPPFVYVENHHVVGLDPEKDPMVYGETARTRIFDEKFGINEIGGGRAAHERYQDRMVGTTLKDTAIAWIRKHQDEPFFIYFASTNIHHPFTPFPAFIGSSQAGPYGDFIQELDWMVGEILRTLEEEGLKDNTLVIFTSDNGGMLNRGGQTALEAGHKANGDLLGWKFDAWEGGHRVPFIARWPGKIKAGMVSDQLYGNIDIFATLAALTGYQPGEDEGPDSRNMLPVLLDKPDAVERQHLMIAAANPANIALRKGKWMYISAQAGGGFGDLYPGTHGFGGPAAFPFTGQKNSDIVDGRIRQDAPPAQLYNLETDPGQHFNVYRKHPDVVRDMQAELNRIVGKN